MKRLLLCAFAAALLAGCAEWAMVKSAGQKEAAMAADEVRDIAEFTLCKGITVGAWVRAYAENPSKASAWRALCSTAIIAAPIPEPAPPSVVPVKPAP